MVVFTCLVVGSLVVLLSYLAFLQLFRGLEYAERAKAAVNRRIEVPAPRGEIYDRHYDFPLVANRDAFAVEIVPAEVPPAEKPDLYHRLADVLGIPVEAIEGPLASAQGSPYQPVEILGNVDFQTIAVLAEHSRQYSGVAWRRTRLREYLAPSSMAHLIGYVGYVTPDALRGLYNRGYRAGDVVGKTGVERQYDRLLRGTKGTHMYRVDARGRKITRGTEAWTVPPEPGENLVLSVDRRIQILSEKALGERVGSVVVLRPTTGEILAMVSYPHFDPNLFYSREGKETFRRLSLDERFPFLNRALQSAYPPASTFKLVLTAAILEEEVFSPSRQVVCTGTFRYGDREFSCWLKSGHGPVDLFTGLAQSCDVYFYTAGVALGAERIVDYARSFGLAQISGIDLPSEASGFIPSPRWKQHVLGQPWSGGDTVNMSIGQGYVEVTPLQMANLVAMIANQGTVYRPHVLREVRDPASGNVLRQIAPEALSVSHLRADTFRSIQEAMRGVVTGGTARPVITTEAVQIAGKTGTAEVGHSDRWHSWFVGYAPYRSADPEEMVVVVVMVEAENEWEWWAPKAANLIFHGIFTGQSYEDSLETLRPWWYVQKLQREGLRTD